MLVAFTRSPAMTAWRTSSCSVGFSSRFIGIATEPRFDTIVQPFNCAAADFPEFAGKINWQDNRARGNSSTMRTSRRYIVLTAAVGFLSLITPAVAGDFGNP